jgi:hypothetical protein
MAILLPCTNVSIEIRSNVDGHIEFLHGKNKVTSSGRNVIRDLLSNLGYPPTMMALGFSDYPVADSDEALYGEYYSRAIDRRITQESKIRYQMFLDTDEANSASYVKEIGLFCGGTALTTGARVGSNIGTLFARVLVSPFIKDDSKQLTITWEVPISSV